MKTFLYAVLMLALCSVTWGATLNGAPAQQTGRGPLATSVCSFTFTSGADTTFLKYCVTANGNITLLETPQGHEHIASGDVDEGYGFCDFSSNSGYFDYADGGDSRNWNPAIVVKQSSTVVKIARTTADGIWTLTQTFTRVTGALPSARVAMALTNNSAAARSVRLMRFADVDADGVFNNNLDGTHNSSFGWNSFGSDNPRGLVLFNAGKTSFEHAGAVRKVAFGPDPCLPFQDTSLFLLTDIDGSLIHFYNIDVPSGATKTVNIGYKGM